MSVSFHESNGVFRLDTPNATYMISLVDEERFLAHLYFGRRIPDDLPGKCFVFGKRTIPAGRAGSGWPFWTACPRSTPVTAWGI